MTGFGTYAHTTPVDGLLTTNAHFETPPHQREYVWTPGHWESIWDDVVDACERDHRDLHFIGVITLVKSLRPGLPTYLIVDGQQRLTTLSLLLCAVRDTIAKEDEEASREFHPNVWNTEFNVPRLVPRYTDAHIYRDIARRERVRGTTSNMLRAYRYFMRQLKELDTPAPIEVGRAVLRRLQVVWVVLDTPDAITQAFEDLNAKRVQLSQSDLIRSHVFAKESPESQDQFHQDHWQVIESGFEKKGSNTLDMPLFDSFFQHLLTCDEQKNIPKTKVYRRFKEAMNRRSGTEITDRLRPRKDRYLQVRGRRTIVEYSLRDVLDRVRRPGVSAVFPVALAVLDAYAEGAGRISESDRDRALDMLSSYLVRGHICDRDSRRQWRILPGLCDLGVKAEASLVSWLRDRLATVDWPEDQEFHGYFVKHSFAKASFMDAVVRGLERARQTAVGYTVEDGPPGIHVEHVMPKSISDAENPKCFAWQEVLGDDWEVLHRQWVNTPGNLALLAGKVNAALGNAPYEEKKKLLTKAKICLNEDFNRYATWGPKEIADRGTKLAEEALGIWKGPDHADWR